MRFTGLFFAVAALVASPAFGQTWSAGTTAGFWDVAGNWSPSSVPGTNPTDNATIATNGSSVTIREAAPGADVAINDLTLQFTSELTIENNRALTVNGSFMFNSGPGGQVNGAGNLVVNGASTLNQSGGTTPQMSGAGTSTFNGSVSFTNTSAFNISDRTVATNGGVSWGTQGDIILDDADWTNGSSSTFTRTAGGMGTFRLNNNSTFTNNGTVEFSTTPINLLTGSSFTNGSDGTFIKSGAGVLAVNGAFTNSGIINADEGVLNFTNYTDAGGTINVATGASVDVGGPLTITNGKVAGTGAVTDSLTLSGGTIEPGNSPGTLTVDGNLTLDGGATLVLELVDTSTFDILNVTGDITLTDGQIAVDSSGLTANVGDTFEFLTVAGSRTGTFTNGNPVLSTSGTYEFDLSYSGSNAILTVTAVPEPSSLALLGVAGLGAAMRRRRR